MSTSRYVVCPECEGEGYVGTLGAFTPGDLYDYYLEPDEYMAAHEASKVACEACKGLRVLTPEQVEQWDDILSERAEQRAESRYCGYY